MTPFKEAAVLQPFEPKQIKSYILFYAGVILLVVAFYVANTLFNPVTAHDKKIFETNASVHPKAPEAAQAVKSEPSPFKLLPATK